MRSAFRFGLAAVALTVTGGMLGFLRPARADDLLSGALLGICVVVAVCSGQKFVRRTRYGRA